MSHCIYRNTIYCSVFVTRNMTLYRPQPDPRVTTAGIVLNTERPCSVIDTPASHLGAIGFDSLPGDRLF
jgi:hypothetical protein